MRIFLSISAAIMLSALVISEEAGALSRDPFARPDILSQPATSKVDKKSTVTEARKLRLKATMIAGKWSIANLEGHLLSPGDEIQGYKLLEVHEDKAILLKNGIKVTIAMDSKE